jgi:hypothetical protein
MLHDNLDLHMTNLYGTAILSFDLKAKRTEVIVTNI